MRKEESRTKKDYRIWRDDEMERGQKARTYI